MLNRTIEELALSVRATNALRKMGVDYVEQLGDTPFAAFKSCRGVGVKTLAEIKGVYDAMGAGEEGYSDEDLAEMSRHTIGELGLSSRSSRFLAEAGYVTVGSVAELTKSGDMRINGLGAKSVEEIEKAVEAWVRDNIFSDDDPDAGLKRLVRETAAALEPVVRVSGKKIYKYIVSRGLSEEYRDLSPEEAVRKVLMLPVLHKELKSFWESVADNGVIAHDQLSRLKEDLGLSFDPAILVYCALESRSIMPNRGVLLVVRESFRDVLAVLDPDARIVRIHRLKAEGRSLESIGDLFKITRERVRQLINKHLQQQALLFEDYYREPFEYFDIPKEDFERLFPEISKEGYTYLSCRYDKGNARLDASSVKDYAGPWKERLEEFTDGETKREALKRASGEDIALEVLKENAGASFSMKKLRGKYREFVLREGYPEKRLDIETRTFENALWKKMGVTRDREGRYRYSFANPARIWETVDLGRYSNSVISTELIYRQYGELMEELDIRDSYELFYLMKKSQELRTDKSIPVKFSKVPVIYVGDASYGRQAVKLLAELSPVSFDEYYEAWEERYGIPGNTAHANKKIRGAVMPYYSRGMYSVDVPVIDDRDIQPLSAELGKKELWFTDEIEALFDRVCRHSPREAINRAAFQRIGYRLCSGYAYPARYSSVVNMLDGVVFNSDTVDLSALDPRLLMQTAFTNALENKRNTLAYIETEPKKLTSMALFEKEYGLTVEELSGLQALAVDISGQTRFFNGYSIWRDLEDVPAVQKLQGNHRLLSYIMRQQKGITSVSVTGGVILSAAGRPIKISLVCEWLASRYGRMTLTDLEA
ncbi:MAG: hypothetical protein ILO36_00145, partial [Abditibacteriota bacterium]|nr:hypothetical protein [Abditibacteriota bacterium]